MSDSRHHHHHHHHRGRRPSPPAPPTDDLDTNALTSQFEQLMRTKRFNRLQDRSNLRSNCHSPSPSPAAPFPPLPTRAPPPPPPSSSSKVSSSTSRYPSPRPPSLPPYSPTPSSTTSSQPRDLPIFPSPPQDNASLKFRNLIHVLSVTPTKYENPGLLDEALALVPLDSLYNEAEEQTQIAQAQAASLQRKPEWGYQDYVIMALLRYGPPILSVIPSKTSLLSKGHSWFGLVVYVTDVCI